MMTGRHLFFKVTLSALLRGIQQLEAQADRTVTGISLDSRQVRHGDLFLACIGKRVDGADFIDAAIQQGAAAVMWEPRAGVQAIPLTYRNAPDGQRVPVVAVAELSQRAGLIAHRFFGTPSEAMFVTGVTGTNGKTSCTQILAHCQSVDASCGVIGTLGHGLYRALQPSSHTTPDAVTLHRWLAELREQGAASVAMEVSSHALDQGRITGVAMDCAVFTNLSRDHLDYHEDMASYAAAKGALFSMPGLRYAVINSDDPFGRELMQRLPAGVELLRYGLEAEYQPDVLGSDLQLGTGGIELKVATPFGDGLLKSNLLGRFNASNLLAVLCVLLLQGIPLKGALARLATAIPVPGRMETYGGQDKPLVVVDYAHTPDALQQVLQAVREHCRGRLWCVFGCGGDRDQGKRPLMGRIAEKWADRVVLTNDNPRNEDPRAIIDAIREGMKHPDAALVEPDRRKAIARVVSQAGAEDVVVVAGKGHETWQLIGDDKQPFSDAAEVQGQLERWYP